MEILIASAILFGNLKTEVQINLCEQFSTLNTKLDLHKWDKKKSDETYFIENKFLFLFHKGWVFKVQIDRKQNTAVVMLKKNALLNTGEITPNDIASKNCEYDLHGDSKKISCKLNNEISLDKFYHDLQNRDFVAILSHKQTDWLKEKNMDLPVNLQITTGFNNQDYILNENGLKIVLGVTVNAKQQEFIEFSARSDSQNELKDQKKLLNYLRSKNVQLCENQNAMLTQSKLESYFLN